MMAYCNRRTPAISVEIRDVEDIRLALELERDGYIFIISLVEYDKLRVNDLDYHDMQGWIRLNRMMWENNGIVVSKYKEIDNGDEVQSSRLCEKEFS